MNIKPSYWNHAARVIAETFAHDGKILNRFNRVIDSVGAITPSMQHKAGSELMSFLGRMANPAELGAQFGKRVPLTAYGDAALGVKTAPKFGDALRFMADFHHQIVPLMNYSYIEQKSEARFVVGFRAPIDREGEVLLVSWAATMLECEVNRWSGRTANIKKLELTQSSKSYEAILRKHLSAQIETDHDTNAIVFDRMILDIPNPTADREAFESVVTACQSREEIRQAGASARMRDLIMSNIGAPPPLEVLAKLLNMTPRQMRLALAKEKTSYQEILRACRVEYASALFKNPALSVSQIAHRLGYSDLSAFTHSFVRWTGKNPSAYRIEMLAKAASSSND